MTMKKIYRKLHLWLSVPFGIFISLICFSGSMLVFEKEISEWCRPDLYFVQEVGEKTLPLDELLTTVSETLPDSVFITGVTISPDVTRTYQINLSKPRRATLYIDQYTGKVKGRNERLPFYDTMFHLHRWMMGTSTGNGKLLVGISTLILVIILITGILMWLTNRSKPLTKSLKISFTKGWPRFWHDLHIAGGIYATIFLLIFALTGLTWSFSWYRTGFYNIFGAETPANENRSNAVQQDREYNERSNNRKTDKREGYRLVREGRNSLPSERSETRKKNNYDDNTAEYKAHDKSQHKQGERKGNYHNETRKGKPERIALNSSDRYSSNAITEQQDTTTSNQQLHRSPFTHWQNVYESLAQTHPGYRQISLSDGYASVVPAGRNSLRSGDRFDFDAQSGIITGTKPYVKQDKSTKIRNSIYTLHVGNWGGIFTRILSFLAALLGATLPLTGYYLWIRKLIMKKNSHNKINT